MRPKKTRDASIAWQLTSAAPGLCHRSWTSFPWSTLTIRNKGQHFNFFITFHLSFLPLPLGPSMGVTLVLWVFLLEHSFSDETSVHRNPSHGLLLSTPWYFIFVKLLGPSNIQMCFFSVMWLKVRNRVCTNHRPSWKCSYNSISPFE